MARIIIIPEAADTRAQVKMLVVLNKAVGAAVIMSQCLHTRQEGAEDGTDEGALRCLDCGATGKPEADDCPHGADGRDCEEGCSCKPCHDDMVGGDEGDEAIDLTDACDSHPDGCPEPETPNDPPSD